MKKIKIIKADYIITMDEGKIVKQGAIAFDTKIVEIGDFEELKSKYKECEVIETKPNTVLIPGLINTHTHLEFSSNKSTLKYGSFVEWLKSVIINRESLMESANTEYISKIIDSMVSSGTTSFGAISSNGFDLQACASSKAKVVFFNEAIGSAPAMVDGLFADFKARYEASKEYASERFFPAIAIHSPYAIHPIFTRKVLEIAKWDKARVSAHLLESAAEREWLDRSSGDMLEFFESFLKQSRSLISSEEFIKDFGDVEAIFTHTLELNDKDKKLLLNSNHSIAHCPVSNRLLNNKKLDLSIGEDVNIALGTDGLSSNISLNMFDELRAALYLHENINLETLAEQLITMATRNGAKALGIHSGVLSIGRDADILALQLPNDYKDGSNIFSNIILHTKKPEMVFINGEEINGIF